MVANVARKASRADAASGWASETAVVSSITPCAVSSLRAPRGSSKPVIRSPYSAFLLPSRMAPATPPIRLPPAATDPARANCDAPVNARRLSTQAWATFSPEPTAAAPKASPEVPTASPRAMLSCTGRAAAWLFAADPSLATAGPLAVARLAVGGPLDAGGPLAAATQVAVGRRRRLAAGEPVCASGPPLLAAGPLVFFVTPEG